MAQPRKFLVIDDNADGRALLARTLRRKFPDALLVECGNAESAVFIARTERLDAIISHRAGEVAGETLIRLMRTANSEVPIIMVSGVDRTEEALAAGATRFFNYDAWLGLGTFVADLLETAKPKP